MQYKAEELPKGAMTRRIYYETARKRYRVRLYLRNKVCWLSYHSSIQTAQTTLVAALDERDKLRKAGPRPPPPPPQNLLELLNTWNP